MKLNIQMPLNNLTQECWNELINTIDLSGMQIKDELLQNRTATTREFYNFPELVDFPRIHNNKVNYFKYSYAMCLYYFNIGLKDIPFKQWENGKTTYFPKCDTKQDKINLDWFSYFSDIAYYKLLSVWDSIFFFIKIYYNIEIKNPYYSRNETIKYLEDNAKKDILDIINTIKNDDEYKKAKLYRDANTHNFPCNDITCKFVEKKGEIDFPLIENGECKTIHTNGGSMYCEESYTSSQEIMNNINKLIELLNENIPNIITNL